MNEIEIINSITFYGFAIAILAFVLLSIFARRILYTLLFAVIVFFCTGGIFFSLGADYNAVVQIAVYGVAVPVIFLFAIMFTSNFENRTVNISFSPKFFVSFISTAFLFIILWYSIQFAIHLNNTVLDNFIATKLEISSLDSLLSIAKGLYINYQFAFILFALMLLIVVVGISTLNVIKEKRHG